MKNYTNEQLAALYEVCELAPARDLNRATIPEANAMAYARANGVYDNDIHFAAQGRLDEESYDKAFEAAKEELLASAEKMSHSDHPEKRHQLQAAREKAVKWGIDEQFDDACQATGHKPAPNLSGMIPEKLKAQLSKLRQPSAEKGQQAQVDAVASNEQGMASLAKAKSSHKEGRGR